MYGIDFILRLFRNRVLERLSNEDFWHYVFVMETKFNSFVETFYLLLEDSEYLDARSQINIMKQWCEAYRESLKELGDTPEYKEASANCNLFQQVLYKFGGMTSRW